MCFNVLKLEPVYITNLKPTFPLAFFACDFRIAVSFEVRTLVSEINVTTSKMKYIAENASAGFPTNITSVNNLGHLDSKSFFLPLWSCLYLPDFFSIFVSAYWRCQKPWKVVWKLEIRISHWCCPSHGSQ